MPIIDLSRAAFAPEKRYASVGFQMGRVASDDDLNEAERIESEDERQERLDVIGPAGSPDDGFRVGNGRLGPGGQLDFDIAAGTFYLGGLRLWNPALTAYAAQPDWLQQPPSARAAPVNGRVDLAFLESWQQPVTAIED